MKLVACQWCRHVPSTALRMRNGRLGVYFLCAFVQWGTIPMSILVRRCPTFCLVSVSIRAPWEENFEEHTGYTYCDWVVWTFESAPSKQWSRAVFCLRVCEYSFSITCDHLQA